MFAMAALPLDRRWGARTPLLRATEAAAVPSDYARAPAKAQSLLAAKVSKGTSATTMRIAPR